MEKSKENCFEKIVNTKIGDSVKIWKNVRLVDGIISDGCLVADDCDIANVVMNRKSEFGRRNLIRNTTIGAGSYTGSDTVIWNAKIGNYCGISWNVTIGGQNHNYESASMHTDYWWNRIFSTPPTHTNTLEENEPKTVIGNDVWIAAGSHILEGVTLGNGCVVGAGAVVTKDVAPYCIVGGVPSKTIKKRFDEKTIEILNEIEWWNWPEDLIVKNHLLLTKKLDDDICAKLLDVARTYRKSLYNKGQI
ncbi:MAG: DapH/DapD/GlmU-related protein [Oscillospiraceae bacterium]